MKDCFWWFYKCARVYIYVLRFWIKRRKLHCALRNHNMKQTARVAINFSTVFEKRVVWFPSNLEASVRNAQNISSFVISQVTMKWSFYFNHFYKMLYYNHDRFIIWFYIIQYIRSIALITFNNTNLVLDLKQFFDHTTKERTIRQIVFLSSNCLYS